MSLERTLFVGGVALHGFDQIRNQVVAAFELNVDVGPGRVGAHAQLHQAVVHRDQEDAQQNYDCKDNAKTMWTLLDADSRGR